MVMSTSGDRVSLCCEPGLYLGNSSCHTLDAFSVGKIILPPIYDSNLSISRMSMEEFVPRHGEIQCLVNATYDFHSDSAVNVLIYLLENGTMHMSHLINGDDSFGIENYCLASRIGENGTKSVVSVCQLPRDIIELRNLIVNVILPAVSIPFILAILIIHAILPEMRNIQGHIFRSFLASLLIMFVTIAEATVDHRCLSVIIVTLQFSLLASFFWMNVMAFDIWWTFRGLGSLQRSTSQQETKKFIIYNCYAWGVPGLIVGTGAIMDFLHIESKILIRPGINLNCRFASRAAHEIYGAGPATVTMILNIFFFASTAMKIIRQKKAMAQHLGGADSRRHDEKSRERFNLYLKLFIVMGISRVAGIMARRYWHQLPDYVWYILAAEGNLQGPIIFVIYVWKENTKQMLVNRVRWLYKIFRRMNSNNRGAQQLPFDAGGTKTTVIVTRQENTGSCSGYEEPNIDGDVERAHRLMSRNT